MNKALLTLAIAAAILWHAMAVATHWPRAAKARGAADFTSYHLAVQAVAQGEDPYDPATLRRIGSQSAHPFFYPPPFLLVMQWVEPLSVGTAYRIWFWLDELFALLAVLALAWWWRPLGSAVPLFLFVSLAALTAVPNNHVMGQFNFPVLAIAVAGLALTERKTAPSEWLGGALLGLACLLKMSPALLVAWLLLRRRWRAVGGAILGALLICGLSLLVLPPRLYVRFAVDVFPGFSSGDYNGLKVPILMFGNHSLPNLWAQLWPGAGSLSGPARTASLLGTLALVTGVGVWFRRPPTDLLQRGAQASAVMIAMLLVPVYSYEHHLVWALPAVCVVGTALVRGRLPAWTALPFGLAWAAWAFDLAALKRLWELYADVPMAKLVVQELKFVALCVFLWLSAWLGAAGPSAKR